MLTHILIQNFIIIFTTKFSPCREQRIKISNRTIGFSNVIKLLAIFHRQPFSGISERPLLRLPRMFFARLVRLEICALEVQSVCHTESLLAARVFGKLSTVLESPRSKKRSVSLGLRSFSLSSNTRRQSRSSENRAFYYAFLSLENRNFYVAIYMLRLIFLWTGLSLLSQLFAGRSFGCWVNQTSNNNSVRFYRLRGRVCTSESTTSTGGKELSAASTVLTLKAQSTELSSEVIQGPRVTEHSWIVDSNFHIVTVNHVSAKYFHNELRVYACMILHNVTFATWI